MYLLYAFGLIVLFLVLLALELFIPSGGLLGIAAAISILTAVFFGFMHSLAAGASILIGASIVGPLMISFGLRLWPRTSIGKRILNIDPQEADQFEAEQRAAREAMIGKRGVALTNMLPSGLIEIAGRRQDAVSVGMAIDAGQAVEVVNVIAGKIQVRPVDADESPAEQPLVPQSLETPIESLGLEDWK